MGEHAVTAKEVVDASKDTIGRDEALALVRQASVIRAAKGSKVLEFKCKGGRLVGDASEEDLARAVIGPSGNLRAPTLWAGKTLYVGFTPELYAPLAGR